MGSHMLDDIFDLLELANKLEETKNDRIEAATKYYEAVYLMKTYLERLPQTESEMETRRLLHEKVSHYEKVASKLMTDDSSSNVWQKISPRSPIDEATIFHKNFEVISLPVSVNNANPHSADSDYINSHASQANNKLSLALDLDDSSKPAEAIARYMEAAELYLEAVKRIEALKDPSDQMTTAVDVMKRRLLQIMDRIEDLRHVQSGRKNVIDNNCSGRAAKSRVVERVDVRKQSLTAEEVSILKRSSQIASGLFLPWSEEDATAVTYEAFNPKSLFRDPDGFLPLNEKQKRRFCKWARPTEIAKMRQQSGFTKGVQSIVIVKSISPYTIRQQFVTDCSFIASLCICASFERRFRKQIVTSLIFPKDQNGDPFYNRGGKYLVRLWLNGVARSVIIDDYLPVDKHGNLLCSETSIISSSFFELWVPLIEKAYMKLCGGYTFPGSNSGVDLFSLTGWIPERIHFAHNPEKVRDYEIAPERAWERIFSANSYGDCLITVSTEKAITEEDILATGLVSGHAYAVLSVVQTKGGIRLLQLKNPWAKQAWKGRVSCDDRLSWSDKTLCAEVGYNPELAKEYDDGIFWISWDDILKYFQNFHLSWNPSLFRHRSVVHGFWPHSQGPVDDTFNVGENPQYILSLSDSAIKNGATVWILVSRHVTKQEQEGTEADDYLTVHIHRNDEKKRRIWYPGRSGTCVLTGAYTNSPQVLVRYDVKGSQDAFLSLILSQYQKSNDLAYTLSCFSTAPFTISKPIKDLEFSMELTSAWTKEKCGGPLGTTSFALNPTFAVLIPSQGTLLQVRVSTVKTCAINVIMAPVNSFGDGVHLAISKPILDSGKYRHGFVATDIQQVAGGAYDLLITNFNAGVRGKFHLTMSSSSKIKVRELS